MLGLILNIWCLFGDTQERVSQCMTIDCFYITFIKQGNKNSLLFFFQLRRNKEFKRGFSDLWGLCGCVLFSLNHLIRNKKIYKNKTLIYEREEFISPRIGYNHVDEDISDIILHPLCSFRPGSGISPTGALVTCSSLAAGSQIWYCMRTMTRYSRINYMDKCITK